MTGVHATQAMDENIDWVARCSSPWKANNEWGLRFISEFDGSGSKQAWLVAPKPFYV